MNAFLVRLGDSWSAEPVAITALVAALVDALIAFGAPISPEQKTALVALVSTLGVLIARSQVTPTANLPAPVMAATIGTATK